MSDQLANHKFEEQIKSLQDEDPRVRLTAIGALARLGDEQAVGPLSSLLQKDKDQDVRARAASALGQINSPSAIEALMHALADEIPEVRRRAALALNQFGTGTLTDNLLNVLCKALADSDRDVRRFAARLLGQLDSPSALEELQKYGNDSNPVVKEEVIAAIRNIEDRRNLQNQRVKVEELRQQHSRMDISDSQAKVKLEGQIDLEQIKVYRLEASLAAQEVTPPAVVDDSENEHQKQLTLYKLQQLIRELRSLSGSVREAGMRTVWESQLKEGIELEELWKAKSLDANEMQPQLQERIKIKEDQFNKQQRELIEMVKFIQESYNSRLGIQRVRDQISDPNNKLIVENWSNEADAGYELLKLAREQGDYQAAQQQYTLLLEISRRTEELKKEENKAKEKAGWLVLIFVIISMITLLVVIVGLHFSGLDKESIPILGLPYSVVAWSAIGSIAAMLYQFLNRPVSQLETMKWLVARPIQGILMGSFLYFVIAGGIIVLTNREAPIGPEEAIRSAVKPELAAVIAFLGGFSDRFADEMVRRATSILSRDAPV